MFSAPSPLPTALGVLCLSLSVLPLFLPFPLNFLPWDGGWGLKLSQGIAHTGRPMTGRDIVARVGRAEEPEKLGVGFGLLSPFFLVGHMYTYSFISAVPRAPLLYRPCVCGARLPTK